MPKSPKKAAEPAPEPIVPRIGDKVRPGRSEMVYEILRVHFPGDEVDLHVPGTNLQRFRERTDNLTFVERKPPAKTSNPFTTPEPTFGADEILERIRTVQEENMQRLDDDLTILTKYLKTKDVPKAAIYALETLRREQLERWERAANKISDVLDER
jgi:hypothetical protein